MFGRKKKEKTESGLRYADSGLRYAGPAAEPAQNTKPAEVLHTFDTNRGPLEMNESNMILSTKEGSITIPYHQVDAWDDQGRKFTVWWTAPGDQHYTMSCEPKMPPASLSAKLQEIIHQNTFEI